MSLTTPLRSLFRTALGNWVSRFYLAVVAALLVWSWADAAFVTQADSSFAGIYPVLATAPVSVALLAIDAFSGPAFPLIVTACALLNSWLIGLTMRRISGAR
ncbi:hypothetical protein [Streptomyces sp. NPDC006551]|uniref:SCO4225 family membrane protein n=1 Tax=Streptomyces sp. NPDC006551 TaxID=3157178 RepID=UPI0033AE8AD0